MRSKLGWVAVILVAAAPTSTAQAQVVVVRPTFTTVRVRTTVRVPDSGSIMVGGYDRVSEGRAEFGAPVVGRVPYVSRATRNIGYGRSVVSVRVRAAVRIIDLREEEFRQTGVRSR
jgi:type II secretory pathway component GspD/PulD (secretin)